MIVANTIPNRIGVAIYLKSISLLEKFAYTDINISENKKAIKDFRLGRSKAFYNIAQNIKRQLKHKREAKRAFEKSSSQFRKFKNAFSQIGRKQSSLDSKLEGGQTISFNLEEIDKTSFLNAFAKSAETEMHHSLSVYSSV